MSTMTPHTHGASRISASRAREARPRDEEASLAAPVTPDRIRVRAYELFRSRCDKGLPGDAAGDWTQAEIELNASAPDPSATVEVETQSPARGERVPISGR